MRRGLRLTWAEKDCSWLTQTWQRWNKNDEVSWNSPQDNYSVSRKLFNTQVWKFHVENSTWSVPSSRTTSGFCSALESGCSHQNNTLTFHLCLLWLCSGRNRIYRAESESQPVLLRTKKDLCACVSLCVCEIYEAHTRLLLPLYRLLLKVQLAIKLICAPTSHRILSKACPPRCLGNCPDRQPPCCCWRWFLWMGSEGRHLGKKCMLRGQARVSSNSRKGLPVKSHVWRTPAIFWTISDILNKAHAHTRNGRIPDIVMGRPTSGTLL